jgi:erythromycin esterase-like protein
VAERKYVRPALAGSYEQLFHRLEIPSFQMDLRSRSASEIPAELLERAIGVIYLPQTERWSHYFFARLSQQFDAVIHFDESRAVEPLERNSEWDAGELPETYPSAV